MGKEPRMDNQSRGKNTDATGNQRTSFLQAISLILGGMVLCFALLEGGLALFGVDPVLQKEDPFVGFSGNVPLFVESLAPNGLKILKTAPNKLTHFNQQMFVEEKASDTFRIFCLGGSTTYGRPYNDKTSFPGWLRELLPEAQKAIDWEVINVGGISYASYRVARLMEDLVQYQPDLFIIYTGQNEFLEERTYRDLKKMPEVVRTTVGWLAKTRTWAAMNTLLGRFGALPKQQRSESTQLAAEVDTILEHSSGPKDYQRDDALRDDVLEHYRISLERMVGIARKAGAQVIFVTPASNLKDCSPFKSEHTSGLDQDTQKQSETMLAEALRQIDAKDLTEALQTLDQAIAMDPRYAELHYRRGKVLFAMAQYDAAFTAFKRASDEDVCPLRALTSMPEIVTDVASEYKLPLVDFVGLLEQQVIAEKGHRIPGEEYFLDHVHPTVNAHKVLAVALAETMIDMGIVQPDKGWGEAKVAAVDARIKSRIDRKMQAQSLLNLAKVMQWAGKSEDADRLASQAIVAAKGNPQIVSLANDVLIKRAKQQGNTDKADQYIRQALATDPWSPVIHFQLGIRLLQEKKSQEGASHILFATKFWDHNKTNSTLGLILYQRGRYRLAYPYLKKAMQQSPSDKISLEAFEALRRTLGATAENLALPEIAVLRHPSEAPRTIFLKDLGSSGQDQPDGFLTEWYEDGSLKRYADYVHGILHGLEVQWDKDGQVLSRTKYAKGGKVEL